MYKILELEVNISTDSPSKIAAVIEKIIENACECKDDKETYDKIQFALGNLILLLIRSDRFVFGIKDKKNNEQKNNHEHMN